MVGTVGAVGVVKAGGAVCTMVVSGPKGVVVVGTRCGAGTAWGAVAREANDSDGVVEAGGKSEVEEDHVVCNGEGCPNKCSTGVGVVPDKWDGFVENWCGSIGYPG